MKDPFQYPWLGFIPSPVVNALATIGPIGFWGKAPGTNGSVVGLLVYTVFFHHLGLLGQLFLGALIVWVGIIFCGEAERRMFKHDPGEIILDEVVAVPLVFLGLQPVMSYTGHVWAYMIVGFALFRLFDIAKPFGIARLQRYPGGLGVVADDLGAALASAITLRLILWALSASGWLLIG